jgi:hypothetical protein
MSYEAISATTATLIALLEESFGADPLFAGFFAAGGGGGNRVVSPRTPQEMGLAQDTGLSVWLYQIARDPELLNLPQERLTTDRSARRPLPLRLHYLLTPVVQDEDPGNNDPGMEQLIIGKVLQTFHDHPKLSGVQLRGSLTGSGTSIRVRLEPLALEEITRVWDALESSYQLCVSYEVSLVMVASDSESVRTAPVESVEPEHGLMREVAAP